MFRKYLRIYSLKIAQTSERSYVLYLVSQVENPGTEAQHGWPLLNELHM